MTKDSIQNFSLDDILFQELQFTIEGKDIRYAFPFITIFKKEAMMFNLEEFIRLLKKYKSSESSRVADEKDEQKELEIYEIEFKYQVLYQNRNPYLELLQKFAADPKMSFSEFYEEFYEFYNSDQKKIESLKKDFEKLATFPVVEESDTDKVDELISEIFYTYDLRGDMICDSKSQDEIEKVFRESIISIYNSVQFEN